MPTKVEMQHAAGEMIAKTEKRKQSRRRNRKSRVDSMPKAAARQRGKAKTRRRKDAR